MPRGKKNNANKGPQLTPRETQLALPNGTVLKGASGQLLAPNRSTGSPGLGKNHARNVKKRAKRRARLGLAKGDQYLSMPMVGKTGAADPRKAMRADTREGLAYGLIHMHPAIVEGGLRNTIPAVPDGASGMVVTASHHGALEIAVPTDGATPPKPIVTNWDLVVVQFASLEYGTIYMRGPVGWLDGTRTDATGHRLPAGRRLWEEAASSVKRGSAAAWNTWTDWEVDALSGVVHVQVYVAIPTTLTHDDGTGKTVPFQWKTLFRTWRLVGMSHTTELMSSITTNQGRVVAGQFSADVREGAAAENISAIIERVIARLAAAPTFGDLAAVRIPRADTQVTTRQFWGTRMPKLTLDGIISGDHESQDWPAVDGAYMPLRMWREEHERISTDPLKAIGVDPDADNDGGVAGDQLWSGAAIVDPAYGWSYCVFTGLSADATVKSKYVYHSEVTVDGESTWAPFQRGAPPRDALALDTVSLLSSSMPHVFVADENDLGSMIGDLAGTIGKLGIPIVSDIANIAKPVVGGLGSLLGGLF